MIEVSDRVPDDRQPSRAAHRHRAGRWPATYVSHPFEPDLRLPVGGHRTPRSSDRGLNLIFICRCSI